MKEDVLNKDFKIFQNNIGLHIKQATPSQIKRLKDELKIMIIALEEQLRFSAEDKRTQK